MNSFKSLLHYYLREKLWRSAINLCSDELKKGKDPYINFWRSYAYSQEGSIIDAIRDGESLLAHRDYRYSAGNALIVYHNLYSETDNEKISKLMGNLYDIEASSTVTDLVNCARFYSYTEDDEKYEEVMEKLTNLNSDLDDGEDLIVKGWKLCNSSNMDHVKEAQKKFEAYVEKFGSSNIDALMGGFKCLEKLKEYDEILDSFQEIAGLFQNFLPLHLEKCRIFLMKNEYENVIDYIGSKLSNVRHFELFKVLALSNLIQEGDFASCNGNLDKMWELMIQQEPKNPELYYRTALVFSRTCDRRPDVVRKCEIMIDRALEFNPSNSKYIVEKGYCKLHYGEVDKAHELFSKSVEIDPKNKESALGLIYIKIIKNKLKEALDDVEFLKDIFASLQTKHPKLFYFEGVIRFKLGEKEDVVSGFVQESLKTHVELNKQMQNLNKYDIIIATEYDFLYDMTKLLLMFYSFSSTINLPTIPETLNRAQRILSLIVKNKYFISAQLLNGKLKYLLCEKNISQISAQTVLQLDPLNLEALTLSALLSMDMNDYVRAKEFINEAMINYLSIARENAFFMILKAKCELGQNDSENAQKTLNDALKVFDKSVEEGTKTNKNTIFQIKAKDKLELMKLNIEILLKLGKTEEAQQYINNIISEFQDMGDDLLMLHSELALKSGDVKKAVNLLKKVTEKDEGVFKQSRIKLSNIYLTHLMERRLYTWCYIEILEKFYSFENLKLAGNALMAIDSPDEAAEYYSKALKEKNDICVMRDFGRALVKTHDYKQAISYYLESLNGYAASINSNTVLTYYEIAEDFINVMFRLSSNDPNKHIALKTHIDEFIAKLVDDSKKFDDYQLRKKLAGFKFVLSKTIKVICIDGKSANHGEIYKNLEDSLRLSKEVMARHREMKNEQAIKDEKAFQSEICFEIGKYYELIEPQLDFAEKAYTEAINNSNANDAALYALANLNVKLGNLGEAHKYADVLLRLDDENEDAITLLISIINSKRNNEFTINYLENILEKQNLSFKLIEIYIEIIRRVGKLTKVKEMLYKCEKKLKYTYSPGLYFCKGLYFRYSGEINKALVEFSKAKTDEHYGAKCIEQMLEIYINPDCDILLIGLESPFTVSKSKNGLLSYHVEDLNLEAIQFLLKELKIRQNENYEKTAVYEAYVAILLQDKNLIDQNITTLQDILNKNKENIAAWIALTLCNLVTNRINEVKANLKIMEKVNMNIKYYNDYERGIILSAYLMIMTENVKKGEEFLNKMMEINIAQVKTYDYLGMIKEKQKAYQEACVNYEKAWEYSNKNNANIGYKLAVSYLNSKQNVKAINICNEIKRKFKTYPIDDLANQAKSTFTG